MEITKDSGNLRPAFSMSLCSGSRRFVQLCKKISNEKRRCVRRELSKVRYVFDSFFFCHLLLSKMQNEFVLRTKSVS